MVLKNKQDDDSSSIDKRILNLEIFFRTEVEKRDRHREESKGFMKEITTVILGDGFNNMGLAYKVDNISNAIRETQETIKKHSDRVDKSIESFKLWRYIITGGLAVIIFLFPIFYDFLREKYNILEKSVQHHIDNPNIHYNLLEKINSIIKSNRLRENE